jgi:hypothetical protein
MELKSSKIKSMNDLIGGILLIALGLYLCIDKNITQGRVTTGNGGIMVRPDMYLRMLGGLLVFLAVLMVVRSINFKKVAETAGFKFVITKENGLTAVALVLFTIALPWIGFAISTFVLTVFLVLLYMRKEFNIRFREIGKKELRKRLGTTFVFAAILDVFVYFIFAKVLHVTLP